MTDKDFELDLDFLDDEKPNKPSVEKTQDNSLDLDTDSNTDDISSNGGIEMDISSEEPIKQIEITTDDDNFLWDQWGLEIPSIIVDDTPSFSNSETVPDFIDNTKKSAISNIFSDKKNIMIAWIAVIVLIVIWVWAFFMLSSPKKPAVKIPLTPAPTSVIEDQSNNSGATESSTSTDSTGSTESNSGNVAINETTNSWGTDLANNGTTSTNSGAISVDNTWSSTTTPDIVSTEVKKDSSDISIPLQTITEKVEVNADGSLKKTTNTDLETRNVKEWSIILDNSQNKLPNLLDLTISWINSNQTFKVSDEIIIKLDWITNSLSIDPSIKWSINKDSYIIDIKLQFFKDSIISSEKWTLKYSESVPLDFMKPGIKKLFILVNWTIFKTINFNIQ